MSDPPAANANATETFRRWHAVADIHHLVPGGRLAPVILSARHLERHDLPDYQQLSIRLLSTEAAQALGIEPLTGISLLYRKQADDSHKVAIVLPTQTLGTSQAIPAAGLQMDRAREAAADNVATGRRDYRRWLSNTLEPLDSNPDACMAIVRAHSQLTRLLGKTHERRVEQSASLPTEADHDPATASLECYRQVQRQLLEADGYWWRDELRSAHDAIPATSLARPRLRVFVMIAKQLLRAHIALDAASFAAAWRDLQTWDQMTEKLCAAPEDFVLDMRTTAELGEVGQRLLAAPG